MWRRNFSGISSAISWRSSASDLSASGAGHVGHRVLVVQAVLGRLEARRHVEDRLALLHRDDAAGGEAAPFEIAHDAEDDREILVARPHEIGVERVRDLGRFGRSLRRLQRLRDHLPAEHAADAAGLAGAAIEIGVDLLDRQIDQARVARRGRRGRRCPCVSSCASSGSSKRWRVCVPALDWLGAEGGQYPAARASRSAWKLASPNISASTRARFM